MKLNEEYFVKLRISINNLLENLKVDYILHYSEYTNYIVFYITQFNNFYEYTNHILFEYNRNQKENRNETYKISRYNSKEYYIYEYNKQKNNKHNIYFLNKKSLIKYIKDKCTNMIMFNKNIIFNTNYDLNIITNKNLFL